MPPCVALPASDFLAVHDEVTRHGAASQRQVAAQVGVDVCLRGDMSVQLNSAVILNAYPVPVAVSIKDSTALQVINP